LRFIDMMLGYWHNPQAAAMTIHPALPLAGAGA
jgi:hypothetical protein